MIEPKCIFLETTIQVYKVFDEEKRGKIFKIIDGKKVLTSTYVEAEFKRTFLYDCIRFYNILRVSDTVKEAINRTHRAMLLPYLKDIRKTSLKEFPVRIAQILNEFAEDQRKDKNRLLRLLRRLIIGRLMDKFDDRVDEKLNKTNCAITKLKPVRKEDSYDLEIKCDKRYKNCKIGNFLTDNKNLLRKVVKGLESLPPKEKKIKSLNNFIDYGKKVLSNTNEAYGKRTCWPLGDIIISLENPIDCCLYTTNEKHFASIYQALKRMNKNNLRIEKDY